MVALPRRGQLISSVIDGVVFLGWDAPEEAAERPKQGRGIDVGKSAAVGYGVYDQAAYLRGICDET